MWEALELPKNLVPVRNCLEKGCLDEAKTIQTIASLFATVMPRPIIHFCESQLVGTAEKYSTLPDLKYLGLCTEVLSISSHYNVSPAIFFLMHGL
jgi:hypothetical protein